MIYFVYFLQIPKHPFPIWSTELTCQNNPDTGNQTSPGFPCFVT